MDGGSGIAESWTFGLSGSSGGRGMLTRGGEAGTTLGLEASFRRSAVTAPQDDGPAAGPTVTRMLLGAQLRRLREAAGVSREAAGYAIRGSESKISRMELGRVGFKERDVMDLLTLYGTRDQHERAELLS